MLTSFDNNSTGFGCSWDNDENATNAFRKRYRAELIQTKQEMVEIQQLASPFKELLDASVMYQERHPVVNIKLTTQNLELMLQDFKELTELQQFLRSHNDIMEQWMKYRTWKAISK